MKVCHLLTVYKMKDFILIRNTFITSFNSIFFFKEVGGYLGMEKFVHTDEFKALNIGFSLDEGIASPAEAFDLYYAERTIWQIEFICHGQSGHGSMLFLNTPGEKIHYIIDKLMNFRKVQIAKLDNNPEMDLGDVTSVNMTLLNGGTQGKPRGRNKCRGSF